MASGTVIQKIGSPEVRRHWLMADSIVAVDDGVWVDVGKFVKEMELEFKGITTGTMEIRGDSGETKPLNTAAGDLIGTAKTTNGRVNVTHPPRWMKVRTTVQTTGTFIVTMTASA